jgi:hypothetical protein
MIGVGLIAESVLEAAIGPTSQGLVMAGNWFAAPWFWPLAPFGIALG